MVERFYEVTIGSRLSGAPAPEALRRLTPYLSDTLSALLAQARRRHDADVARAPDEKPAFAEGDLFSSLFEGPTAVQVLATDSLGSRYRVTVRLTDNRPTPAVSWTDVVVLSPERDRPVIDDIEYGGTWDFASKGTLRANLVAALAGR